MDFALKWFAAWMGAFALLFGSEFLTGFAIAGFMIDHFSMLSSLGFGALWGAIAVAPTMFDAFQR